MMLAAEVFLAVLEQPARHRQQDAALRSEDEAADYGAVRGEREMRAQLPVHVGVEQLGEQQRVEIAFVNRAAEHRADRFEDRLVLIVGGASPLEEVPPETRPDVALDVAHHGVDAQGRFGHPDYFAENASSTFPGMPFQSE
jgi:hypothetical protein